MNAQSWRDRGIYLVLLGLAVAVLLQATILTRIRFFGAQPDLLLVLVVCWSLQYGVSEGLLCAFIGGLALDVVAGLPLGASPVALMSVCLLTSFGRRSVYAGNVWLPLFFVVLATPVHGWIMLLIRRLQGVSVDWLQTTLEVILPVLFLNILLTIIVARVMRWASGPHQLAPVV
jgi:rod shape-determining protein MreD